MRLTDEKIGAIRARIDRNAAIALDMREGRQARDYRLAGEVDAELTVNEVRALLADLEEARAALRAQHDVAEHIDNCDNCSLDFLCDEVAELYGRAAELRRKAITATKEKL